VTFLFSDIEGSTELLERIDGAYVDVLHRYHGLVRAAVQSHGGLVVDAEGDGIFCVFEDAADAAQAAVEIQRGLAAGPLGPDAEVRARIGIHTGRATATPDGYVGLDVHRAARIGAAGHGGQILTSAAVHGLLLDVASQHQWHIKDLGSFGLKGLSRAERLHQLDAPGLDEEFPPPRARRPSQVRLPAQLTSLVARGREIGQVASLLTRGQTRLVSLTGAGGIGKTRLAVAVADQVANDYPDGVYFVNLAQQTDPDLVLTKIAEAAEVPVAGGAIESLADAFAHQRVLLVVDNFEQLVAGAAALAELLKRLPGLHLLVTSRIALRLGGEYEFRVEPLDLPVEGADEVGEVTSAAAVRLFVERARTVRPSFQVTEETAGIVSDICRRLDGLPLAIELAAARLRLLSPKSLLDQLGRSLDALGRGAADLPERQQTLRSTIDWSHDLLTAKEQRVFRRLSMFAAPWTLEALEEVAGAGDADVVDVAESLVEKSLLRVDTGVDGEPRFRMLVALREYGAEKLRAAEEHDVIRARHAAHYLRVAEQLGPRLSGAGHGQTMHELDGEWENLRRAVEWFTSVDDREAIVRLAWAIAFHIWLRGHVREAGEWIRPIRPDDVSADWRGHLHFIAGSVSFEQGDYAAAVEQFDRGIEDMGDGGDRRCLAWTHYIRAGTLPAFGADNDLVQTELTAALELFWSAGDELGQAWAHTNLGMLAAARGDIATAIEHHQRCLLLADRLDTTTMRAQAHTQLGFTHLAAGDVPRARESLAASIAVHRSISYREGLSYCLDALAALAMNEAAPSRAMVAIGAAEATRDRLGIRPWPAVRWFLDFLTQAADAVDDSDLQAARAAGRQMDPLAAAELALG
jgi:predicted ATPase/class 3 adenylate cyclase